MDSAGTRDPTPTDPSDPWHEYTAPLADGTTLRARFTTRSAGDFAPGGQPVELAESRSRVVDLPWVWLRQVHGSRVVEVGRHDLDHLAGTAADGALTAVSGIALSVVTADCAPVLLWSDAAEFATVHVGWRGAVGGVIEEAVGHLRRRGGGRIEAVRGPCIGAGDYAFGSDLLDEIAAALGAGVRARTTDGRPALDLPAAVEAALAMAGVGPPTVVGGPAGLDAARYFSHRRHGDLGRQALVAWKS